MSLYKTWLPNQGPSVLQGPNGRALAGQTGTALDNLDNLLLQGLLARFPTKGNVDGTGAFGPPPSDAVDQIAADRNLRRGSGETDASLGTRAQTVWDFMPYGGAHYAVLRQLQIAGYANMYIVQDNGRYMYLSGSAGTIADLAQGTLMTCIDRTGDTPGWQFDLRQGLYYSQYGIVFTSDATNLQTTGGQTVLNNIVQTWGPATANYVAAWVILAGGMWGWPTGQTYGSSTWGSDSIRTIPGNGSAPFVTGP